MYVGEQTGQAGGWSPSPCWIRGGHSDGTVSLMCQLSTISFGVRSNFYHTAVDKRVADLFLPEKLQEYFQGLESHTILTETLFRKIISFAAPQETQLHTEVMAQASAVLKGAHKRGVALEYILEVRRCSLFPGARIPWTVCP